MAISRPTLQSLIDQISADYKANISGATTLTLRSVLQVMARTAAGVFHLLFGYVDNLTKQLFAKTASTSYLELIGSEYGIFRLAAVASTGNVTLTGTPTTVCPAGTLLQSPEGDFTYSTNAEVTIPGGGSIACAITATTGGLLGDQASGVVLTFVSPIVGISSNATVDASGLGGGSDEETDEELRARILARKQFAPHSGCATDYVNWAKECAGVTRAWCYPLYQGPGTLAVFFVDDNDVVTIIPSAADVAIVDAYLRYHLDSNGDVTGAPVTASPGLFVLAPTQKTVNFTIGINPSTVAVKAAVLASLQDIFYQYGGPALTVRSSQISNAIQTATGVSYSSWTSPQTDGSGNIACAYNEVPVVGTITWTVI